MATKKFIELQEFATDDLVGELTETEAQYRKLRFDHAVKGLDDPMTIREVRRDIARMKTELRRRELADATPEDLSQRSKTRRRRRRQRQGK